MSKYTYNKIACPPELLTPKLKAVNSTCLDIVYQRGIRDSDEMENFLFPSLANSIRQHPALLDTDKAVKILSLAAKNRTPTVVYHDYDVDGITAAAVTTEALRGLGIPVSYYSNDRAIGGFGIGPNGVDEITSKYPDTQILITVDNGVSGLAGVARAKELGLTVIVTDHHEPDKNLPAADAILDHKRQDEPDTQDKNCCGAGVVWKLMLALYVHLGKSVDPIMNALDLVALGTIADVVPLLGQNRAFVQEGLRQINAATRPFFSILSDVFETKTIDSQVIAFQVAPMINAVSRMDQDASPVVSLLLETDESKLRAGIIELDELNLLRREETSRELTLVMQQLFGLTADQNTSQVLRPRDIPLPETFGKAAIVFRNDTLKEGVIGIVAGQLKEAYGLPTAVFTKDKNGNWKGSCRSPGGFHLKGALDKCAEYLISHGGHGKAAGVTVRAADFALFQAKFEELAIKDAQDGKYLEETVIDAVLPASDFTESFIRELSILEPFGEGFPKLLFGLKANIERQRFMGTEQQHIKYVDASGLEIVLWNQGPKEKAKTRYPSKFVGYPQLNCWNGNTSVQFVSA